jgi:glycosyltransferase involved in cell wall biosynthesis
MGAVISDRPRTSLIVMKWPTDAGYAITALERLFYDVALCVAGGNASRVHFAYPDITPGPPASLPAGFPNVHELDLACPTPATLAALEQLVRTTGTEFVLAFDTQPLHSMFRVMRRSGVQTILSYWGAPISSRMPWWRLFLKRTQLRWSQSRADGLVFESRAMADLATNGRGVPSAMIDIVPLGVDADRFRPSPSTYVYDTFDVPRDRRVVVFSGHCTPRKGIKTLIEAAIELLAVRQRRDVFFLICGNRGEESRPYEAMYAGLGIEPWIRFAGYRTDMLPIFQSAFCGVIPSSGWDSFTLSAVEMAATGLPVVASRLQGLAEAVIDRETGLLFEPANARDLADSVQQLLDGPALAASLGQRGRDRAVRDLSLGMQRARLLGAIRRHLVN